MANPHPATIRNAEAATGGRASGALPAVYGGDTGGFVGGDRRSVEARERSNEYWAQLKNIAA